MPTVYVREGESLSSALQKFAYKCNKEQIVEEYSARAGFESEKQKARKKRERKIRRRELKKRSRQSKYR